MANPQKTKGDVAERKLVAHLQANGFPHARRTKAGGEKDLGDLSGIVDRDGDLWCVQVADRRWRSHGEIEAKAAEALAQAELLGAPLWCLVAKRPRAASVGDWFVWLPVWELGLTGESSAFRHGVGQEDLACVTVRTWLALIAPTAQEVAA